MEEGSSGSGAGLPGRRGLSGGGCAIGTQARAPPKADILFPAEAQRRFFRQD